MTRNPPYNDEYGAHGYKAFEVRLVVPDFMMPTSADVADDLARILNSTLYFVVEVKPKQ